MMPSTGTKSRPERINRGNTSRASRHAQRRAAGQNRSAANTERPLPKITSPQDLAPTIVEVVREIVSVLAKPVLAVVIIIAATNAAAKYTRAKFGPLHFTLAKTQSAPKPADEDSIDEKLLELKFAALADQSSIPSEPAPSADSPAPSFEEKLGSLSKEIERAKFLDTLLSSKTELVFPLANSGEMAPVSTGRQMGREDIEDLKSEVKFISGLIAVHRPSIADCGLVAKEIVRLSMQKRIDPFLVAAIISIESNFGATERSHVGATGLMQLMPSTARAMVSSGKPQLTDVRMNITLGIDYYRQLEAKYNNRLLALAAYNWGPTNVDKVGKNFRLIPRSVQKYATTIVDRNALWASHYRKAKASASSLDKQIDNFLAEETTTGRS